MVTWDHLVIRVLQANKENQVIRDLQDKMVLRDQVVPSTLDHRVHQANKEILPI